MYKVIKNEALGLEFTLPALKQRDIDRFFAALRAIDPHWRVKNPSERASALAKAGIEMGFYPDWTARMIDDCDTPGLVAWMGAQVDAYIGFFITIPPDTPPQAS